MAEKSTGTNALEGLIIPPDEATLDTNHTTLYSGSVLLLLLLGILVWRWLKSARTAAAIAQKKLDALERELEAGAQTTSQAQRLITILSTGLGVRHLNQYQSDDNTAWASFTKKLNSASFSKASSEDITALIRQARFYLEAHQNKPEKAP